MRHNADSQPCRVPGGVALGDKLSLLRERYPALALQILSPFHDALLTSREVCGGDMDAFLIMLTVALRTVDHDEFRRLTAKEIEEGSGMGIVGLGTNARSVADSIGIPRETVRRKVDLLVGHGFLAWRHRSLYCTPAAFRAFTPVREVLLRMVVRQHRLMEILLQENE
jgi:hypothetical protein